MTSTHVPPGNLESVGELHSLVCRGWDPKRAPCLRLCGVANCHLSGATTRLTSVSSQHPGGRAHPHHISATTQHSSETHGSLRNVCRAARRHAVPCPSRRSSPPRYFHSLTALLLRVQTLLLCFTVCNHDWGVDSAENVLL